MNIVFPFEEESTPSQINEMYTGQTGIILTRIKDFIKQRLSILKDEIDRYPDGIIKIMFPGEVRQIRYYGFPSELGKKMVDSITQDDYEYIFRRIWSELYPGELPPSN